MKTKTTLLAVLFSIITVIGFAQWNDQASNISNDLNSVFFIDNNTGWAVGHQGKIIYTSNGGSTWTQQNSGTTEDLNKVFMVNTGVGYAVGDKGIFLKYNGTSWSKISINYSQDMHGIHFINENTGWISGDWGRIMKTTNGGTTWSTQMDNGTFTNLFYDLFMLSENEGWATGTSGRVLKYNGSTWSNVSIGSTTDLYAVHFSSPNNGFIVGKNSKVHYFNGSSWNEHNTSLSDNSYHIKDVHVIDQNTAYAAVTPGFGGQGIILKYNGSSWTTEYEYTDMWSELFYGIHFPSSSKGYAVGAGGLIKTKGSGGSTGIFDYQETTSEISVFPNPIEASTIIKYNVKSGTGVNISITDLTGKVVYAERHSSLPLGEYSITFDGNTLNNGVYFLNKTEGSSVESIKIIKGY